MPPVQPVVVYGIAFFGFSSIVWGLSRWPALDGAASESIDLAASWSSPAASPAIGPAASWSDAAAAWTGGEVRLEDCDGLGLEAHSSHDKLHMHIQSAAAAAIEPVERRIRCIDDWLAAHPEWSVLHESYEPHRVAARGHVD